MLICIYMCDQKVCMIGALGQDSAEFLDLFASSAARYHCTTDAPMWPKQNTDSKNNNKWSSVKDEPRCWCCIMHYTKTPWRHPSWRTQGLHSRYVWCHNTWQKEYMTDRQLRGKGIHLCIQMTGSFNPFCHSRGGILSVIWSLRELYLIKFRDVWADW